MLRFQYSEKLVLVTQAAFAILPVIPYIPPSKYSPYTGGDATTNVRAALQKALDTYAPGSDRLILPQTTPADLRRSDTRSFGQTHAKELDNIGSTNPAQPTRPITPPSNSSPPPITSHDSAQSTGSAAAGTSPVAGRASSPPADQQSPPLNPAALNQAPAPIPVSLDDSTKISPVVAPNPEDPSVKIPSVLPTVAETGVPKSAGPDGPGPASGSLLSIKSDHDSQKQSSGQLPGYSGAGGPPPPEKFQKWESAEEEKKRLEREERERILHGQSSSGGPPPPNPDADGDNPPPAYQEL